MYLPFLMFASDRARLRLPQVFKNSDKDNMSKDLPEDSAALELVKQKLLLSSKAAGSTVVAGKASKTWSELVTSSFRHGDWKTWKPGASGFNKHAQEMMEAHNVPDTPDICVPGDGRPCVQPYQQVVSYMVHPKSYTLQQKTAPTSQADPSQRLLVVHRTGAGKTCSMIRIADNYFNDRRPKILLFPSPAVCSNFYMELLSHRFPNRYADYLQREGKLDDVRNNLELRRGGLMCGRVRKELLDDPLRPSAPLRAFSYTQAGGRQAIGDRHRINPVFKCPDGYGGGWCYGPGQVFSTEDGYVEYESDGNPFSNKIVLMDEFHNLVKPSPEIRKSPTRMMMLDMLKEMLRTAKNSVLVGFTATPLVGDNGAKELLDIIKGKGNEGLADEGFLSYFMGSPRPVFPTVVPPVSQIIERSKTVPIQNLPDTKRGNLREYCKHQNDEVKALQRCSLGQHFGTAGQLTILATLKGGDGKLCGEAFPEEEPHPSFGYCPDRVRGYASKLSAVCDDVGTHTDKTLVLVHSTHGFKLLLRLLATRFPDEVLGYVGCNASQTVKWDAEVKALIGDKHSEVEKAKGCCSCNICLFNDPMRNLHGEHCRVMVADAKFCSEGVSFLGVRQFALVDMPENAAEFVQRVGRAVRFNGHAGLPAEKSNVHVRLYCATLPVEAADEDDDDAGSSKGANEPPKSADERRKAALIASLNEYEKTLQKLQSSAVDFDQAKGKPLWNESGGAADLEQADAANKAAALELELEAKAKAAAEKAKEKAAAAKAKVAAAKLVPQPSGATSFQDSTFKKCNDELRVRESSEANNKPITVEELWESTEVLVAHYEGASIAAPFIEGLRAHVTKFCEADWIDEDDVKTVSMLMWAAGKFGNIRSELCSLINRAIREDQSCEDEVLYHAVLITRAIGKNLVANYQAKGLSRAQGSSESNFKDWPNGPQVDLHKEGWSSNRDTTWRGGGMPRDDLQWYLDLQKRDCKKFRTKMFVASSFSREVADDFSQMRYDSKDKDGTGKVLFCFRFERHNCLHVNYIDKTQYPQEKEFLLPPYTALELVKVDPSPDLDARPHRIEVKVMPDNQKEDFTLPLANRI